MNMPLPFTITLSSDEPPVERAVGGRGETSGRIYVPKAWIGRRVTVILMPEEAD